MSGLDDFDQHGLDQPEIPDNIDPSKPPLHVDASDADEQKRLADLRKHQEHQAAYFWRTVFSTEAGRREMYKLLDRTGAFGVIHRSSPNGSPAPLATEYYNGQRDLGLAFFLEWTLRDRAAVFLMLDENDPKFMAAKNG